MVIRETVKRNIQLTRYLESLLRDNGFSVLAGGQLSIVCARWEPADMDAAAIDELQSKIAQAIIDSGTAWFSTVKHEGKIWLRLNLVNIHTRSHHVETLAKLISDVVTPMMNASSSRRSRIRSNPVNSRRIAFDAG